MVHTKNWWMQSQKIFDAIICHPFLKEMVNGTLNPHIFIHYLEQDALYVTEYTEALTLLAAKMNTYPDIRLLFNCSQEALTAEKSLHEYYFHRFDVMPSESHLSPTSLAYTAFLKSTVAFSSPEESMAALLPCFWVYHEVGTHLSQQPRVVNNPYQEWIDLYSKNHFETLVNQAICFTEKLAVETSEKMRESMKNFFILACRHEWMFWDSVYRLEKWQPEI